MAKISGVVEEVMDSQELSLRPNAFGSDTVITRLGYNKGTYPEHLEDFAIPDDQCAGLEDTVTYQGKTVPKTAACVAANSLDDPPEEITDYIDN